MLNIYNTFSNKKEEFKPLDENLIKMYVCGPTVYNEIHVGNARTILVFDLLFRILKKEYKSVVYVRNLTDIDDKIINKALKENKTSSEVANYWADSFALNCKKLNTLLPTHEPKATETIPEIIDFISNLIEEGFAYIRENSVFFKISELSNYGSLSKNKELLQANRIVENEDKQDQRDFILWKPSKVNEPYWRSPWGKGRPGWHIECSAMSLKFLGKEFDIHAGGQDLIFPHHENEQAQNIGLNGELSGPKYWMHNAMLLLNGEKMSKSIGNIVLLSQAFEKYEPSFVRFFILGTHYRHMLMWNEQNLEQSASRFDRWVYHLQSYFHKGDEEIIEVLYESLKDDLNMPEFLKHFDELLKKALEEKDNALLKKLASSLNFIGCAPVFEKDKKMKSLEEKLEKRMQAKIEKNYELSDFLRKEIERHKYEIVDEKERSYIKKLFNSIKK